MHWLLQQPHLALHHLGAICAVRTVGGLVEPCEIVLMVTFQGLLQLSLYFYKLIFLLWKDFQEELPVIKSELPSYKCANWYGMQGGAHFNCMAFDCCFFVLIKTYSF